MALDVSSRNLLTRHDLPRFTGETLFDRIARTLCAAECLPRKELFESWEVARRVRRKVRGHRVVDLACGHGLVAPLMLLLDDTSPSAVAIDARLPESAPKVLRALVEAWPRLHGRVTHVQADVASASVDEGDVIVSAHACGNLTDQVLDAAIAARAPVAVLPCCHDVDTCDLGGLGGWMDASLAIDATRVARLRQSSYRVSTQRIPIEITHKNRLILAIPNRVAPTHRE